MSDIEKNETGLLEDTENENPVAEESSPAESEQHDEICECSPETEDLAEAYPVR